MKEKPKITHVTGADYRPFYKEIDHDAITLNNAIDEMFARDIKELIPKAMASAAPGVAWSASICTLDGERAFKITGQFTEADGNVLEGRFMIYQRVILDGEREGKGWVERCKGFVSEQMRERVLNEG